MNLLLYARCSLLSARCSFLFAYWLFLFACCSLLFACCWLLSAHCSLPFACCSFLFARCSIFARCSLLFAKLLLANAQILVTCVALIYIADEFFIFLSLILLKEIRTWGESKVSYCCFCFLCKPRELGGRGSPRFPCLIPVGKARQIFFNL